MKKLSILSALLLASGFTYAQDTDTLALKDMEMPGAPAFILLDKAPSTIARPGTGKAFALSVLNSFQENNGIPKNYAAEFTPFWFFSHPSMNALKYAGYNSPKQRQRIFGNISRASVSLAFVSTTDTLTSQAVNNLSLGLRVNLISVRSKKNIEDIKAANAKVVDLLRIHNDELDSYIGDDMLQINDPALYHIKVQEFLAMKTEQKKEEKNNLKDLLACKPVFAVDGALGYNTFFLDNNYSDNHFGRLGAWLTVNYAQLLDKKGGGNNYLNAYAVARYLSDGTTKENGVYRKTDNYDMGGKLELEFRRVSFAYEYIYRITDQANTFRSSGMFRYKISDQLVLTGAFGKNFGNSNNLISMLGINLGFANGNEKSIVEKEQTH